MAAVELFKQCTDMEKLSSIGLSTWLQFADVRFLSSNLVIIYA